MKHFRTRAVFLAFSKLKLQSEISTTTVAISAVATASSYSLYVIAFYYVSFFITLIPLVFGKKRTGIVLQKYVFEFFTLNY